MSAAVDLTITKEQKISSRNSTDGIVEGLASKAKVLLKHGEGVSKQKPHARTLY